MNQEWKENNLVILYYKNNKEECISDIGIIKSFSNVGTEVYADIQLLYSKYSPVNTFIHAPRNEVYIIADVAIENTVLQESKLL